MGNKLIKGLFGVSAVCFVAAGYLLYIKNKEMK